MRILIIEDDRDIATHLYDFLAARGHVVDAAPDGATGLRLAVAHHFDAIVLEVALPDMDGIALCRKLRDEAHVDTPVLILTARDTLEDKLRGFEHGADDYLVKPFALKEVEARLAALHNRHAGRVTSRALVAGALTLDPRTLTVRFGDNEVKLPPKCIRLLEVLMREPGRLFSRAEIESAVWGEPQETSDTLRSHVYTLRRALLEAGGRGVIETVHGSGYRLATDATDAGP